MNIYKIENWVKSIILTIFVAAILFGLVYYLTWLVNPYAARISILYALISVIFYILFTLLFGKKIVLLSAQAKPLEGHPRYKEVKEIVEKLAKKAKVPMPELYLIPGNDINAFATGFRKPAIAITEGALRYLDKEELEGVLAHEISHIKNADTLYMTLVSVMVGLISHIANFLQFAWIFSDREKPAWAYILAFIISILIPLVAVLIQLAISRQREYLADLTGAELVGSPWGLINAFKKIQQINMGDLPKNEALEPLYFVDVSELFSTHPPIEKRIERLLKAWDVIVK